EDMLIPALRYARPDVHVLISRHADGRIIAKAIQHLGLNVVYGSSRRGGTEALLRIFEICGSNHIAVTPDGPRGPRPEVQLGIAYIAAKTGLPIVPVGFGYASAWRTKSWDRMALPRPFSRVVGLMAPPICVPDVDDRNLLEVYRLRLEHALGEATRLAQFLAC